MLHACTDPCQTCRANHLDRRADQLAKCCRIQRQALLRIVEEATENRVALIARNALKEAKW